MGFPKSVPLVGDAASIHNAVDRSISDLLILRKIQSDQPLVLPECLTTENLLPKVHAACASRLTLTGALKMASGQDYALKDVATAQARMGDFTSATQTLNFISDREYGPKSEWFTDLAMLAFKSGRGERVADLLSRAMACTNSAPDDQVRSQWIQRVMLARAETGDVPSALEYANELSDKHRIKFLDQIATIQAKGGDISGAERTESQLPEAYVMSSAAEIALAKVKAGDFVGASRTATWQEEAQISIMRAQTKAGDLEGALSKVAKLKAPKMQVDALVGIAQGLLDSSLSVGNETSGLGETRRASHRTPLSRLN